MRWMEASVDKTIEDEKERKDALLAKAVRLEKEAGYMESLCSLVRNVAEHRQDLFEAA